MACPKHLEQSIAASLRDHLAGSQVSLPTAADQQAAFEMSQEFSRKHYDIMDQAHDLGLEVEEIYYNAAPAILYEQALRHEEGSYITATGALSVTSGKKNGPLTKGQEDCGGERQRPRHLVGQGQHQA